MKPLFERPLKTRKPLLFANYSEMSIRHMDKNEINRILDACCYTELSLPDIITNENAINDQLEKIRRLNLGISPENTLVYFREYDDVKLLIKEILQKKGFRVTETLPEANLASPQKD